MKIVIAPDSFKESMSAFKACQAIEEGIHAYDQSIETVLCPLADGGEGTLETLVTALKGTIEYYEVTGPLFHKIKAPIGYVEDKAIIECAKVCGLELLKEEEKNPYYTTSYGLGELMLHALNKGIKQLIICLGGSATNDGGIGMLSALGIQFTNHQQPVTLTMKGLSEITNINFLTLDKRLLDVDILGVCDVKNPLCGQNGATYIYGPQKGLIQAELEINDQAMNLYASLVDNYYQYQYSKIEGTGAAGGLGYALLAVCKANLKSGFEIVSDIVGLEKHIQDCDVVIVGEGKMDQQTKYGKTPYGVLCIAEKYQKPIYAFAGRVEDQDVLKTLGFYHTYEISLRHIPLSIALKKGPIFLKESVYKHMEDICYEIKG